ncbi:MAG: hypothetical protein HWD61_11865 [Parachlamydiaceae bacterium]|nr:MAG: hypothetical protein HWD61_11865 [Parachlamydiaceae bacterium]
MLEACNGRLADLVQGLLANGADVNQLDRFNRTVLGVCIHVAKFFLIKRTIKYSMHY